MKTILAATATLFATSPLWAEPIIFESPETPVALIELFTSEGCSSCPPAEAWVSNLKTSPDLWKRFVPVVFHVDYWDRLGWPDRFASRENTERQRRYAAAWRSASVYTPGFALDGREWRAWSAAETFPAPSPAKVGRLRAALRDHASADVIFAPASAGPKPVQVELALLGGDLESNVKRGENIGRKLRHDFVVVHLATAALRLDGASYTARLTLPAEISKASLALAVWVTSGTAQPPLQATGGWLKNR